MATNNLQPTRFDVLLGEVKAFEGEDHSPRIVCTASSDQVDLGVDRFMLSALEQMKVAFPGQAIFLNHKYAIPEDVFGVVSKASIIERSGYHDLDLEITVDKHNDRAMVVYRQVQSGVKLGVSVGVLVEDAELSKEKLDGKSILNIKSVTTLEASIVGIPANRRSWTQGALKAASAFFTGETRELLEKLVASIETSDGGKKMAKAKLNSEDATDDEPVELLDQEDDDVVDEFFIDAEWSTAYINNLADSAFATVLSGGAKDGEGKTKPRSLRKLPHHDSSGAVDEAHLNNALSREPQTNMPASNHKQARAHLNRHKGKKGMALDDDFKDFTEDMLAELDPGFEEEHFVADEIAVESTADASEDESMPPKKMPMKPKAPDAEETEAPKDDVTVVVVVVDDDDEDDDTTDPNAPDDPMMPGGRAEIIAAIRSSYTDQKRKWFSIKEVKAETDESQTETVAEINIYDAIGSGLSARDFVEQIANLKVSRINVRLNSPGGVIDDGIAIRNALARHSADVYTYVDGIAASMASVIALVGKEVTMEPDTMLMLHEPWGCAVGEAKDMEKQGRILNKYAANISNAYARKAGGSAEDWRNIMRDEGWYTPDEALAAGLIDRIGDGTSVDPEAKNKTFDLRIFSMFKNAPEAAKRFFSSSIEPELVASAEPDKSADASDLNDMATGITGLANALRSAHAENESLRIEAEAIKTELKTKDAEKAEALLLLGQVMEEVNKVLDSTMPRKTSNSIAENIATIATKYPWLDARIIAQMSRPEPEA